jgi:hypothetical protein
MNGITKDKFLEIKVESGAAQTVWFLPLAAPLISIILAGVMLNCC